MSTTDDIDAVLEEWQGSVDAMRWAPDLPEEAVDGEYYNVTGIDYDVTASAARMDWEVARAVTFGARFGVGVALSPVGESFRFLYETAPLMTPETGEVVRPGQRIYLGFMGGRSITMDFPHHDEASCPACQLAEQMAVLLDSEPQRYQNETLHDYVVESRVFPTRYVLRTSDLARDLARGLAQMVPLENIVYDEADWFRNEPEDPVERVTLRALRSGLRRPEVDGIVVRNWSPRSPRTPLRGERVSYPLPSLASRLDSCRI